jgi:DNA-binding response OmpR family regulator
VTGTSSQKPILVVDDHKDAADSLVAALTHMGHKALAIYDGAAALAAVKEFEPRLVLLDIGMPGVTGYDIARQLRAEFGRDKLTLVAVTVFKDSGDRILARQAGFDAHLGKPVDYAMLDSLVRTMAKP